MITVRGVLTLLPTGPLIALSTWFPEFLLIGWAWFLLGFLFIMFDFYYSQGFNGRKNTSKIIPILVSRQHDSRLSLAANNTIKIQIENRLGYSPKFWFRDEVPDEFPGEPIILKGILPSGNGSRTWVGQYSVFPTRRGDYQFGNFNLRWEGPLGLIIRQVKLPGIKSVKVYPNLLDIERYDLLLKRNRLQEMGLRHSRLHGAGTEYERLREYQPDDDYRRIDWKSTARRRRPVTIDFQVERSQTVMAVLDTGRMMQSPVNQTAKLDYAVNAVLLLGYVASSNGDRVGLLSFADQVEHYLAPDQGKSQFYKILEQLYTVRAQPVEPDFRLALTYLERKQRRRSLVVIFTDLTGGIGLDSLVKYTSLLRKTSLPLVVTISDPEVIQASLQNPSSSLTAYQRLAAKNLLADRQVTLDRLHRSGVLTLDVPANNLSIAVINRYLELKSNTSL